MKNNSPQLGQKITSPAFRDAIHLATAPVKVTDKARPGDHVGLLIDGSVSPSATPHIGVLDPFLKDRWIQPGEQVWLCLYPNTVTSLRHEWQHPAFEEMEVLYAQTNKNDSIEWLKRYAITEVFTDDYYHSEEGAYNTLLNQVEDRQLTFLGRDCHGLGDVPDANELFRHLSVVLGKDIDSDYFEYFGCSC